MILVYKYLRDSDMPIDDVFDVILSHDWSWNFVSIQSHEERRDLVQFVFLLFVLFLSFLTPLGHNRPSGT